MADYLPIIISALALLYSLWAGKSKETKEDSTEMAKIMTKLENISEDLKDLKKDISDVRSDVKENSKEVARMQESLKSAWNAIHDLQKKKEG